MWKLLAILLVVNAAQADELRLGGGMGLRDEARVVRSEYVGYLSKVFDYKAEIGISGPMQYGGVSLGIKATEGAFFVRYFCGPSLITITSNELSSNFQFNHDLELGIKSSNGVEYLVGYKHMSNAGLTGPNLGRDWIMVGIGIHW